MPTLPTFDVTTDQANRMLAAYAPYSGATQAETIDNYKERLRQWIVQEVIRFETEQVRLSVTQAEVDKKAEVIAALPPPPASSAGPKVPTVPNI